jgi:hypothetical protein
MMNIGRVSGRRLAIAGASALIALSTVIAGCGKSGEEPTPTTTPTTTTTTTTAPPSSTPPAPTEKSINPTAGNLFTPGVTAPSAPNVPAGQHPGINGVN